MHTQGITAKQAFLALLGTTLLGISWLVYKVNSSPSSEVIIEKTQLSNSEIIVEISGSVNFPGVYRFTSAARVDDLISKAGGLTDDADKEFVEKTINRASVLKDGQKIYISSKNQQSNVLSATKAWEGSSGQTGSIDNNSKLININTSSVSELESLWGIGPKTAQKIIEQRPYSQIEDLLTKSLVKGNVYQRIKDQISVY